MIPLSSTPVPIPPVGRARAFWAVPDDSPASRADRERFTGSYESAIPAPIADLGLFIPASLAADVDEATAAIRDLDGYAQQRLGPESAAAGPMSAILLRTESASSSQIENLTVGARQLALAELEESRSENARLVVSNVHAMEAALRLANRLDADSILEMHRVLMQYARGWEEHAGRFRDELVWVGTSGVGPVGAVHVAPQAELVPAAIDDLVRFVAREDIPPIIQAAVAHAQFETIHPFGDGNGRTGRALVHALLRGKGMTRSTTIPVSAGLLTDTQRYFDALTAFREGDAAPIIERLAFASRYASISGRRLIDELDAVLIDARTRTAHLRADAAALRLIPALIGQPVINVKFARQALGTNDMTAQRAIAALVDAGVLTERTGLRRNRVYQQEDVIAALESFAQRIHRR
ncbi:MAG: Fic family protein [Microbacteriaceae bacterium]|nr:Fic family protein [Microbacteriaceae bacterium]